MWAFNGQQVLKGDFSNISSSDIYRIATIHFEKQLLIFNSLLVDGQTLLYLTEVYLILIEQGLIKYNWYFTFLKAHIIFEYFCIL